MRESTTRQRLLEFDGDKEARRLERVARICGQHPKLTTGARLFDYAEATRIARLSNENALERDG